jgi:hypothetical protein
MVRSALRQLCLIYAISQSFRNTTVTYIEEYMYFKTFIGDKMEMIMSFCCIPVFKVSVPVTATRNKNK